MRVLVAAVAAGLFLAGAASGSDRELLAAKARYLPPAQRVFAADADGLQARYDAARELEEAVRPLAVSASCAGLQDALLRFARAQIAIAEAADYPAARSKPRVLPRVPVTCSSLTEPRPGRGSVKTPPLALPPGSQRAVPETAVDVALAAKLAAIGRAYDGWAGFWVHDLATGRTAGWNSDAAFPAGSLVKLAPLVASLPYPQLAYDATQLAFWSSNLGANRIVEKVGTGAIGDTLRRLGMWSSTYPGLYRAGTTARLDAPKPPPLVHSRVTTAHDVGRALYRLHAAAIGNGLALRLLGITRAQARSALALLVASRPLGANAGLVRPWLPHATIAQKNAWLSDLRATGAIVYTRTGPVVVVVEAYRPRIRAPEARVLARRVIEAVGLDRLSR
jgi:outer membrane murein-binding lipoprotein Lpp